MSDTPATPAGDRLAKVIARSGLCSRRDAEDWIREGRVAVNGKIVKTPAFNVTERDQIKVDGEPLAARQGTRVWLYHKPPGLVVTEKDPEGRPTIFDKLAEEGLPRVVTIGRLDINTEGLLLLTNDGGLKRVLELPATSPVRAGATPSARLGRRFLPCAGPHGPTSGRNPAGASFSGWAWRGPWPRGANERR